MALTVVSAGKLPSLLGILQPDRSCPVSEAPLTFRDHQEVALFPQIHIAHSRKKEAGDCVL